MKCKECGKQIGFLGEGFGSLCQICYKKEFERKYKEEIELKNKKEIEKINNLISDSIAQLEKFRVNAKRDKRLKKVFNTNFDKIINSLYHNIFSTIISTLENSFMTSFEHGTVPEKIFKEFIKFIEPWNLKVNKPNGIIADEDYSKFKQDAARVNNKIEGLDKLIIDIEKQFNVDELIKEISDYIKKIEEEEIEEKIIQIKEIERERRVREQAEKRIYGKIKTTRQILTNQEQEMIRSKFNNKCALCGVTEGLHIHHKDKNPKNNQIDNLILICYVCHKKIHMKIR